MGEVPSLEFFKMGLKVPTNHPPSINFWGGERMLTLILLTFLFFWPFSSVSFPLHVLFHKPFLYHTFFSHGQNDASFSHGCRIKSNAENLSCHREEIYLSY